MMKLLFIIAALFKLVSCQTQFSVALLSPSTTVQAGQNITIQVLVPIRESLEAFEDEVALAIGMKDCGSSSCPPASTDLGDVMYIGQFSSQGYVLVNSSGDSAKYENFTLTVPVDVSGSASIQVMHVYLFVVDAAVRQAYPGIEYANASVTVAPQPTTFVINPTSDSQLCVGVLGGVYANGSAVDVYECNGSNTQVWGWNGNALTSVNPVDGSQWCLDAGTQSQWANGVKMKIWQCFSDLPQQTWTPTTTVGPIQLTNANFCLDLTNGVTTNQNILQIWTCTTGDTNQSWKIVPN